MKDKILVHSRNSISCGFSKMKQDIPRAKTRLSFHWILDGDHWGLVWNFKKPHSTNNIAENIQYLWDLKSLLSISICDNLSTEQAHGQTLPSIFAFLVMHCINGGTRETFWLIHIFWDRRYSSRYVKNQLWSIWCMGQMPKLSRTYYIPRKMNVSFKQMLPSLLSLMQKILFNIITCVVQEIRGCG